MRIGELSTRTGVSERSLRHYEARGLLAPERAYNGYRDYEESALERVGRIRSLLCAGLSTDTIREVLGCVATSGHLDLCPNVTARLAASLEDLERRRDDLDRSRGVLADVLARARVPQADADDAGHVDAPSDERHADTALRES